MEKEKITKDQKAGLTVLSGLEEEEKGRIVNLITYSTVVLSPENISEKLGDGAFSLTKEMLELVFQALFDLFRQRLQLAIMPGEQLSEIVQLVSEEAGLLTEQEGVFRQFLSDLERILRPMFEKEIPDPFEEAQGLNLVEDSAQPRYYISSGPLANEPESERSRQKNQEPSEFEAFTFLIQKRRDYVEGLRLLDDDWISGDSQKPSSEVLNRAQIVLLEFHGWLARNRSYPIPKLVMSPIPSGGFAFEISPGKEGVLYFSLYNDGATELEMAVGGHFSEIDLSGTDFMFSLIESYKYLCKEDV